MNNPQKTAIKSGGIFGLLGASVIAPVATPVLWAALAYGTYRFAKAAYQNAKLREPSQRPGSEDSWFF